MSIPKPAHASFPATMHANKKCQNTLYEFVHCVSKINVAPLTCYNHYIHGSTATIFGKNVAQKVGNQNVLYFPTSPIYCFCTTWGNRKAGNCVFSLKCCMIFLPKNTKHSLKYHLVRAEQPSLSKWSNGCNRQLLGRKYSILLPVTHVLCVSQICHGVSRCVKDGSCSSSSLEWKSMYSINGIFYYLNKC